MSKTRRGTDFDKQVQEAISMSQLIASFAQSFNPNPKGMDNHAELQWKMLRLAAEGVECNFSEAQDGEFVDHAASIEFEKMVLPLALQQGPCAHPPLLEGEVYVGQIELCYSVKACQQAIFDLAEIKPHESPSIAQSRLASQYQRISQCMDHAASQAVFRPSRVSGESRDARTFHHKGDGVYVLLFENIHFVFCALMPGLLLFVECFPIPKLDEYKLMVKWCRKLYYDKIQPEPLQLP